MPRLNVIVLDKVDVRTWRVVYWADVPLARQPFYADPSKKSAWSGALAADTTNLQNGSVVEKLDTVPVPAGWTLAQVQAEVQSRWSDYQAFITAYDPWVRYGTTWDGTTWTLGGVA